ncbi:hypothetical protein OQA88_11675 [Cercophora sp. LCS_1]
MKANVFGLAAAACWTGVSASIVDKVAAGGHKVIADLGANMPKNSTSVLWNKLRGIEIAVEKTLELRQVGAGGRCGALGSNARCGDNLCCSDYGYCGDSVDHCAPLFSCQPNFGVCGWPRAAPPAATTSAPPPPPPPPTTTSAPPPPPPTTTSAPPPPPTTTSAPPPPPPPPSTTTSAVVVPPSSTQPVTPNPTGLRVTTNGQCGNGTVCIGSSQWGACCSQFFWCGSSIDYCGAGCQSQFGACFGVPGLPGPPQTNGSAVPPTIAPPTSVPPTSVVVPPTSTSVVVPPTSAVVTTSIVPLPPTTTSAPPPPPPPTTSARPSTTAPALPAGQRSSTDGRCGSGQNCIGSTFGRCCSQFGWCGDGDQFCPPIVGCQAEFGICDPARP